MRRVLQEIYQRPTATVARQRFGAWVGGGRWEGARCCREPGLKSGGNEVPRSLRGSTESSFHVDRPYSSSVQNASSPSVIF